MAQAHTTKSRQARNKKCMLVRYGKMGTLGLFEHNENQIPKAPTPVVVKTDKGLELGQVVGQLCPHKSGQLSLNPEQIKKYFDNSEVDFPGQPVGRFVRYGTADDISEQRHLEKMTRGEIDCCRRFVKELDLAMKVVDAEHILGGERIIFYFKAESRVDFRELVKKLAHEYQTRIEMRQIGSRDEAKLLGDVESCGQPCCCIKFLKALKPVNMRMAKMQKATLDPAKISGYCGRLRCCLRFEDETYIELKKKLPKKGTIVNTPHGRGRVVNGQILTQLVVVEKEDGVRVTVGLEDIEIIPEPTSDRRKQENSSERSNDKNQQQQKKQS